MVSEHQFKGFYKLSVQRPTQAQDMVYSPSVCSFIYLSLCCPEHLPFGEPGLTEGAEHG